MLAIFLIGVGLGFALGLYAYRVPKRRQFVKDCPCPDCERARTKERWSDG